MNEPTTTSALGKILRDKDLVKRILLTLAVMLIFRAAGYITLPGVNTDVLERMFTSDTRRYLHIDHDGASLGSGIMRRVTVLAIGIMPFIAACVLVQLGSVIIPPIRRYYALEGEKARQGIVRITLYVTLVLAVVQAWFLTKWIMEQSFDGRQVVLGGPGTAIGMMLCMVAGTFFLLWLAHLVNNYGIGNGVAILMLVGIAAMFPPAIYRVITGVQRSVANRFEVTFMIAAFVGCAVLFWLITGAVRKVPIRFRDSDVKRSLSLRFSWVGTGSRVLSGLLMMPVTLLWFLMPAQLGMLMGMGGWLYAVFNIAAIVFATYLYMRIVFQSRRVAHLMERYGCLIEDVEAGEPTVRYFDGEKAKMTTVAAALLGFLVFMRFGSGVVSSMLSSYGVESIRFALIGGWSLLILVGIAHDLKCQIEARLSMKEILPSGRWKIAYVAFDELEAEIKQGYLATKDIPCVIEPLRLTWGLPIRTAVDQYRLHVPEGKAEEAWTDLAGHDLDQMDPDTFKKAVPEEA